MDEPCVCRGMGNTGGWGGGGVKGMQELATDCMGGYRDVNYVLQVRACCVWGECETGEARR
jgi:hypothetical protein